MLPPSRTRLPRPEIRSDIVASNAVRMLVDRVRGRVPGGRLKSKWRTSRNHGPVGRISSKRGQEARKAFRLTWLSIREIMDLAGVAVQVVKLQRFVRGVSDRLPFAG